MQIRVKLFARAKDLAGTEELTCQVPEPATVADLRRVLVDLHPTLADILEHSAVAVDAEFADDATALADGAVVALLPPVSGG